MPGLDEMQKDALAEIGNISLGASATALSQLVNKRVSITTPKVMITTMEEVRSNYPVPCLVVAVNYVKGLTGENLLIVKNEDALFIVGLMMGMEYPEKPEELGEMELSAISEAMNQMMGSASTAMSDFLNRTIDISPPEVNLVNFSEKGLEMEDLGDDSVLALVSFQMEIEDVIDSQILQLLPLQFAKDITLLLLSSLDKSSDSGDKNETKVEDEHETVHDLVEKQPRERTASIIPNISKPSEKKDLARKPYDNTARLDLIRGIPVDLVVVLGKTKIPLKQVFSLVPGDIINLDSYLGEPVELYANMRLVARGEVVLVNRQFGVRISEIIRTQ